jgi:hypothetical protein
VVSSDEARKEVMSKAPREKLSEEEAFQRSTKETNELFEARVNAAVAKFKKLDENSVLLLDKNHPPNSLTGIIDQLDALENKQYRLELVALAPRTFQRLKGLPFSAPFIFQSLCRLLDRKEHLTLSNSNKTDEELIEIFFMFVSLYLGVQEFDKAFVSKYELDGQLNVAFTFEDPDLQLSKNLE